MYKDRAKADELKAAKKAEKAAKTSKVTQKTKSVAPRTPRKKPASRQVAFELSDTEEVSDDDSTGLELETWDSEASILSISSSVASCITVATPLPCTPAPNTPQTPSRGPSKVPRGPTALRVTRSRSRRM